MLKVKNLFVCCWCKKALESAITLPCGDNICCKHVKEMSGEENNKQINCKLCGNVHQVPREGFAENKIVNQLLKSNLININFGKIHSDALNKCKELKKLIYNFEHFINDKEAFIFETFSKVRNRIDMVREESKLQIDKLADEAIEELNKKEHECKCIVKSNENMQKFDLTSFKQSLDLSLEQLNEFVIDQARWSKILDEAEKQFNYLTSELNSQKTQALANKGSDLVKAELQLKKKIHENFAGKINYSRIFWRMK